MKKTILFVVPISLSMIPSLHTEPVGAGLKPCAGSVERAEKRTRYSKTFQNNDGTFTWAASAASVHFVDDRGVWQDIETEIKPISAGPYAYGMTRNAYQSFFARDASAPILAKVQTGDWALTFGLKGARRGPVDLRENTITYRNALPGADLRFTTSADELRDEIILHHRPKNNVWQFDLNMRGVRLQTGKNGTLDFVDQTTGQRLWFMPKPFMSDANETYSEAVSKTLVERWGKTYLVVKADESWLSDPARRYPVAVDPTMSWTTSTGNIPIRSGSPDTPSSSGGLAVGYSTTTTSYVRRSLIQWDMTGYPPQAQITSAANSVRVKLNQYNYTSPSATAAIGLYNVTADWSETTATWNNMSANIGSQFATCDCTGNGDYTWSWNGNTAGIPAANRGVFVKNNTSESVATYAKVFDNKENNGSSGKPPRLAIDYTAPGLPTATAPTSVTVSSIQWNWTAGSPASGGFKVYDAASAGNLMATVNGTSATSWNETSLPANTSVQRWVAAYTWNTETTRSTSGAKYTLQNTPTTPTFTSLATTSFRVNATGPGNLTSGSSGVIFHDGAADRSKVTQLYDDVTGLSANTQYTFKAKGVNGDGVATDYSGTASAWTLSVAPIAGSVTPDNSSPCSGSTLTWMATGGFGPGKIAKYKYAWNQTASHTWTGSETDWSSGTLQTSPNAEGTWYLHVKGYNGANVENGTYTYSVTVPTGALKWTGGNGNWDFSTTGLWQDSVPAAVKYCDAHTVILDDSASVDAPAITLDTTVTPTSVVNDSTKHYAISGSGKISGSASLTKQGTGTLTLSAANDYSGITTVSAGKLLVNGSIGSGVVTVAAAATLGGNGTIGGAVTVQSGGTLAPGTSAIGTLTFNNAPTLQGTTLMEIDRNGGSPLAAKLVLSSGTLTYGGTLTVNNSGADLTGGEVFDLFDAPAFNTSSSFSTLNLPSPLASGLNWYTGNLTVDGTIIVNRAPVGGSHAITTRTNLPITVSANKLKAGDSDPDGNALSITAVSDPQPSGASVGLTSGVITYNPGSAAAGSGSFKYTLEDGRGGSTLVTVSVTITDSSSGGASPNLVYGPLIDGTDFVARLAGIPGQTYTIESATNPTGPWVKKSNVTAPTDNSLGFGVGVFEIREATSSADSGYYRTVWPAY